MRSPWAGLGVVGVLPMHVRFADVALAGHAVSWIVPVGGLSLLAALIAYVAGIWAARRLGPTVSSFLGLAEVLFAVVCGLAAAEPGSRTTQLIGGALVVAGVVLVRVDDFAVSRPAKDRQPVGDPPGATKCGAEVPVAVPLGSVPGPLV